MKNILFILILMVQFGCIPNDNLHRTIYFYNNSEYKVYVAYSLSYPDTISDPPGYHDIGPNSMRYLNQKAGYENLIALNSEKKIMLFVKKDDPFVIVKRYILTLDSLNILNWKVTYP